MATSPGPGSRALALLGVVTSMVAACGGGQTDGQLGTPPGRSDAPSPRPLAASDSTALANALMNYGEQHFPAYFPTSAPTQSYDIYLYRYYPATGLYLGVANAHVYVMGGAFGSVPLDVGRVSDYIAADATAPAVTRQPASTTVKVGEPASFSLAATGVPAPTLQWQRSDDGGGTWVDLAGATSPEFTTPAAALGDSGTRFRARLTNTAASVFSATATMSVTSVGSVVALVDTGVEPGQCFAAGSDALVDCNGAAARALNPSQDGMTGRDQTHPDGGDGRLGFSYQAIAGGCVRDKLTGLTWEVKTASIGGLRDQNRQFTNFGDGRPDDSSAYVAAVNAVALCGYADWRVPTADELQSIVDYSTRVAGRVPIDTDWFPNTPWGQYITSSAKFGDPASDWNVFLLDGAVRAGVRSVPRYLRLVR